MKLSILAIATLFMASTTPTLAATYELEVRNPSRLAIIRVTVKGGKVSGETCGYKALCKKTVTMPDGVCGGELRLHQNNNFISYVEIPFCKAKGVVSVSP